MSKQYGLILPNKNKPNAVTKPSIFNSDSDSEPEILKPTGLNRAVKKQDKINHSRAIEEDPTVFQYDEIYDDMDKKRKESKLARKDLDRKPKYINRLLQAAEKRKRENERRIERQVQKEREAEGEEFKDKESFVTNAYKKKLEELREMEEQEKREEYLESIGDVRKQGNLDGFYRHLYDLKVNYEDKDKDETKEVKDEEEPKQEEETQKQEDTELKSKQIENRKRKYRSRKSSKSDSDSESNKEEETEPKKGHLVSNLDADSDFSIDSSSEDEEGKKPKTEKKTKDLKENLEDSKEDPIKEEKKDEVKEEEVKKEEPEEKKPKIDIWKKRTVGEVFDNAVKRYFERKALREAGK